MPDPGFPFAPAISDDTQLTIATCEAITRASGVVDPERIAQTFRQWFETRRLTGLGSSTLKALRDLSAGAHWALCGARGEFAAGSGAAMRIAPLAFLLDPANPSERQTLRDLCRITHHNDEAYAGALAVVIAVQHGMTADEVPRDTLQRVLESLPDTAVRDRLEALASFEGSPAEAAHRWGRSGHVVDTIPLALYTAVAAAPGGVEVAVRTAVSLGGDTDTRGALTAQITAAAGAPIPDELWRRLPEAAMIEQVIDGFVDLLGSEGGRSR